MTSTCRRAHSLTVIAGLVAVFDDLLDGVATRFTDGYGAGTPPLRRALRAFRQEAGGDEDVMRWLWLACPVAPEPVAPELWDYATWRKLADRAVRLAEALREAREGVLAQRIGLGPLAEKLPGVLAGRLAHGGLP